MEFQTPQMQKPSWISPKECEEFPNLNGKKEATIALIKILKKLCHANTDFLKVYQKLCNRQLHFPRSPEFSLPITNTQEIEIAEQISKLHDAHIVLYPMLSIGIYHKDALFICRSLTKPYDIIFDQEFTSHETEEGEICCDGKIFEMLDSFISGNVMYDMYVYDQVTFIYT